MTPLLVLSSVAALLALIFTALSFIRMGREKVAVGGATDAAFASNANEEFTYIDSADLAHMAGLEFEPPKDLKPAEGGVLFKERVTKDAQAAWLMQAAIDGYIEVEGEGKNITLRRLEKSGPHDKILKTAFNKREVVALGKYDSKFAEAWSTIGRELNKWRNETNAWDPKGGRRHSRALWLGIPAALIGVPLSVISIVNFVSGMPTWAIGAILGSLLDGSGIGAIIYSRELFVRTPKGTALYLRIESFRKFLAAAETKHVQKAAEFGMLREYTAWAVALDEAGPWTKAMENAGLDPKLTNSGYYSAATSFASSASSAGSDSSSSSGSGGGGGGGGGGSW